jgi:hypothetical protein
MLALDHTPLFLDLRLLRRVFLVAFLYLIAGQGPAPGAQGTADRRTRPRRADSRAYDRAGGGTDTAADEGAFLAGAQGLGTRRDRH